VPNHLAKRAAEREDLQGGTLWLVACLLFALAFLACACFEFGALNTRWDSNAYGSVVWMLLALHTTHLITDTYRHRGAGRADVHRAAGRQALRRRQRERHVLVLRGGSWLPIYAVIYWGARL
jgi:cytochrome c oxidase subunit 3